MKTSKVTLFVLAMLAAIAFGVNWMAFEQQRANSGIFLNPAALDAQPPTATVLPTPTPKDL